MGPSAARAAPQPAGLSSAQALDVYCNLSVGYCVRGNHSVELGRLLAKSEYSPASGNSQEPAWCPTASRLFAGSLMSDRLFRRVRPHITTARRLRCARTNRLTAMDDRVSLPLDFIQLAMQRMTGRAQNHRMSPLVEASGTDLRSRRISPRRDAMSESR